MFEVKADCELKYYLQANEGWFAGGSAWCYDRSLSEKWGEIEIIVWCEIGFIRVSCVSEAF